jgi:hypothetical protein
MLNCLEGKGGKRLLLVESDKQGDRIERIFRLLCDCLLWTAFLKTTELAQILRCFFTVKVCL